MATLPTDHTIRTAREENLAWTFRRALADGADPATARAAALRAAGITPNPIPRADTPTRAEYDAAHAARVARPVSAPERHVARHASTSAPITGGRALRDMLRVLGNCADLSADDSRKIATNARSVAIARVCDGCRVADACAAYAVAAESAATDAVGTYGGRTPAQRHADPALAALPTLAADDDDEPESPWVAVFGSVAAACHAIDLYRVRTNAAANAERLFA